MRRKTRFVCVSDTHGYTPSEAGFRLPAGDVLIHAGDLTNQGSASELRKTMAWIVAADFEVKIVICGQYRLLKQGQAGNHDITLDAPFYNSNSTKFQNKHIEIPQECLEIVTNASPSVVFLQHQSALVRLRKAGGPNTIFKVFGSPYSQCDGNWAFLYEAHEAEQLWRDIPLDADVVVTHMPPRLRCEPDNERSTERPGAAVTGCVGLRERLRAVRPCLAVCGHVHGARGYERVRWGSSAAAARVGDEGENNHIEDEIVKGVLPPRGSKKQSLVDLTGKRAPRLDNEGLGFSRAVSLFPSSSPPDVVILPSRRPGLRLDLAGISRLNAVADTDAEAESADLEQIRTQRRETCIVNAAITATNWPHHGGRKFHPGPIVVDLELPVWTNGRPES
ncbi:metallophosphatase domain-containing protein [Aspergillus mulundensis]|uniref:Calcineurin-like phosphoesterase domain-containing protein n=1 Tax=Aspergillus mulundensis TaxID=1810919 RepID=A0A3D8T4C8_9EURO|nr:hypothetical protein DSM5745_00633 [Aspergillus mulundensis]RDW93311.1 hypothetical protein DSM5745_00633 [Aspergillus mulundensis]